MGDNVDIRLGDYHLVERIGAGGMGEVYRARHVHMGKTYAVKVLPEHLSADAGFVDRFRDEARIMAALDHSHIVHVHNMSSAEGQYFLAMDYVEGPEGKPLSLHAHLAGLLDGRLAEPQALTWATQIVSALAYAHGRGVVHRDIKPANILIDRDGSALLTDFGLAKAVGNEFLLSEIHESMKTLSQEATIRTPGDDLDAAATMPAGTPRARSADASGLLGTYDYMAPEQRGEFDGAIDARTDVYAFGVLLYRMLTGRRPVGRAKAPSKLAGVSPGWDDIVDRCLEYDPADRYHSAVVLAEALQSMTEDIRVREEEARRLAEEEQRRRAEQQRQRREEEKQERDRERRQAEEQARQRREAEEARRRAEAATPRPAAAPAEQPKRSRKGGCFLILLLVAGVVVGGYWLVANYPSMARRPVRRPIPSPVTEAEARRRQDDNAASLGVDKHPALDLGGGVKMKLVLIPAGRFLMGSPETEAGRSSNEGPQREVTISKAFYMGATEVTQEQYEAVTGSNPSDFKGKTNPVEQVFWYDAVKFCQALSTKTGRKARLPTEAEWEYACRAGTATPFHTGTFLGTDRANYEADYALPGARKANYRAKAIPVGSFNANAWGLCDMHGNVCEWCGDWYVDSYANAKNQDPQGPATGARRVVRGGSWGSNPWGCRSAGRNRYNPHGRINHFGFRVVLSAGVD